MSLQMANSLGILFLAFHSYQLADGFSIPPSLSSPIRLVGSRSRLPTNGFRSSVNCRVTMQYEAGIVGSWTLSGNIEGENSFVILNLHANKTVTAPVLVEKLWRGGRGIWKLNGIDFALEVRRSSAARKTHPFCFAQFVACTLVSELLPRLHESAL